jgi:integrase
VELIFRYLSAAMSAAVRDRLIGRTPCEGVKLPKKERTPARVPTMDQVLAIRQGLAPRYRAMVVVAAGTGLRLGEVLGLTVDRVDFLRRTITVDRQLLTPNRGTPRFGPPKTTSSNRVVPVAEPVLIELAEHIRLHPPLGPDAGEFAGLIFSTEMDNPVRRSTFHPAWARGVKQASAALTEAAEELEPEEVKVEALKVAAAAGTVTFHHLRHFYASALIASGCSVVAVQHALGHSTATETLGVYSHLWPTDEDRTRSAIAAIFGTSCAMDVRWGADSE